MIRTTHLYLILITKNELTILVLPVYHPGTYSRNEFKWQDFV